MVVPSTYHTVPPPSSERAIKVAEDMNTSVPPEPSVPRELRITWRPRTFMTRLRAAIADMFGDASR